MKNTAIDAEASSAAWADALRLFDADLRRRGAAEKTRRAYAVDLGQLAAWAIAQGIAPAAVDPKVLRRYAARLGDAAAGAPRPSRASSPRSGRSSACCASTAASRRTRPT